MRGLGLQPPSPAGAPFSHLKCTDLVQGWSDRRVLLLSPVKGQELTPASRQLTTLSRRSNHLCIRVALNISMENCLEFSAAAGSNQERGWPRNGSSWTHSMSVPPCPSMVLRKWFRTVKGKYRYSKKKKILNKSTSDTSDGIIDTLLGDKARQGLQGTGLSGSRCDS